MSDYNREITNLQRSLLKEKKQMNVVLNKLEKLNEQKNELLGMAAHDLRNPISAIKTFSELVLDDDEYNLSSDVTEIMQMINKSSEYMLYLITNLLDISTIESGKLNLNLIECNYIPIVEEVLNINRHYAKSKNIELKSVLPDFNCFLKIDKNKTMQVLHNLIGNAIKYSQEMTTVTIRVIDEGDKILTDIIDQGVGIEANEINLLFKAFSRTSSQPTGDEVSTGLGLLISKQIVEGHAGTIGVRSQIGKGSTFWFILNRD